MKPAHAFLAFLVLSSSSLVWGATLTMTPLATFGGGDGWLAPGEGGYGFLGTANNERGLAYGNNHLYLVSRTGGNHVRILDAATGAELSALNTTGVTGGLFPVNVAAVGGDGAIYVSNMTTNATTTPYKVYKWSNEGDVPTVAYSGAPLAGARVGDSLAGIGSGAGTVLAAGFNSNPSVTGNNGYATIDPTAGTANAVGFAGTPPNAGDFRLGITMSDSTHVWGTQGSGLYRYTSFAGTSGTLLATGSLFSTAERLMAYADVGTYQLLAVQSTGDSHVSIYDVSNPAVPVYLGQGNNTSGTLTANGNGTGQIAWSGVVTPVGIGFQTTLYAMSTNQGIQAFTVTVPEPGALLPLALGLGTLACRRSTRKPV